MVTMQADTIKVNSKRTLQYEQSSVLSLNIRPYKVVQAANWLMSNSSLYRDEGIAVNPEWANKYDEEISPHEDESNDILDEQSVIVNENRYNVESNNLDAEEHGVRIKQKYSLSNFSRLLNASARITF